MLSSTKNYLILGGAIIVVVLILALIAAPQKKRAAQNQLYSNIKVTQTDLTGATKTPTGFPKDIPVETNKVLNSETVTYADTNKVQYNYSYQTGQTIDQKLKAYSDYMAKNGYKTTKNTDVKDVTSLTGTKSGVVLSVVLSKDPQEAGKVQVQVSYITSQ